MISIAAYLLTHAMLLSLHLAGNTGSFPRPLSAKEEREYVEACLAGDMAARNTLVEHNLRLVAHIVKKYYTQTDEQDDLISIGTIGLIKGVTSYRPEKGTRLATYAARCVENATLSQARYTKGKRFLLPPKANGIRVLPCQRIAGCFIVAPMIPFSMHHYASFTIA